MTCLEIIKINFMYIIPYMSISLIILDFQVMPYLRKSNAHASLYGESFPYPPLTVTISLSNLIYF